MTSENKPTYALDRLEVIATLEEYKTELIADVVTGKIKVRNIEIPDYEYVEEDADTNAVEDGESETVKQEELSWQLRNRMEI